jgi:hypothetical protein
MLNEFWSNEVVPCDSMAHPIECDPKENPFNVQYVRSGEVPTGDSVLMYDLGQTHVAVSGCQTSGNRLGDLWVTYDIELKKPLLFSNVIARVDSASKVLTDGLLPGGLFGSLTTLDGSMVVTTSSQTIHFPKGLVGSFFINLEIGGSSLAITGGTAATSNCTLIPAISGDIGTGWRTNFASDTICMAYCAIKITDPGVQASLGIGTGGTGTVNTTRVSITEMA